jgi:hypothetical protein
MPNHIKRYYILILMPKEDYLTEDSILPSGQQWVCISFFSKNHVKQSIENNNDYKKDADKETYDVKNNVMGVKVRGAFETYEEARSQVEVKKHHTYFTKGKNKGEIKDTYESYIVNGRERDWYEIVDLREWITRA